MPLNVRKVSINFAVIFFFILSVITLLSGLSPFTCCKRAVVGAVLTYIAANIAVRLINLILIDGMITNQMEQPNKTEVTQQRNDKVAR